MLTASRNAVSRVFRWAGSGLPFGYQDPEEWGAYERWMREGGLLKRPPAERPPLTNEFLPGEGLDPGVSGLG